MSIKQSVQHPVSVKTSSVSELKINVAKKSRKPRRLIVGIVVQHIFVIMAALIFAFPFIYLFFTSLKGQYEIFSTPPSIFGSKFRWDNYVQVFTYGPFLRYILNSLFVSICGTILVLIVSSLAGYAFSRLRWRGREVVFLIFLSTMMIPAEVIVVPMFILMKWFGWVNTYQSLIFPFAFTAFGTFIMRQFYRSLPYEIDEAGKVDGAGPFRIFFKIILPLAKPSLATLGVFSFLSFWNSYLWPLITIKDTKILGTIPLGLASFSTQFGTRWDLQTAATVVSMVPTVLLVILLQKYIIKGIATVGLGGR